MRIFVLVGLLFSFLSGEIILDDYRTIQRSTIVTADNGAKHKVGDFGNYYALLIYVEKYKYLGNLRTPKRDVEAIAEILKNRYGFLEPKIVPNPKNSDELLDILDDFKNRLNENDNLLIYYAGHGSKGGYWQLSNAKKNTRSGWILIREAINKTLKSMNSRHILVVADSCYSGVMTRTGISDILNPSDREYYSKLHEIKSRNVLTSGGFKPVLDQDPVNPNHSIFANGLLNMLQKNNRPIFSLEEEYKIVERYVEKNSNNEQTPLYSHVKDTGYEKGGDFIFLDKKTIFDMQEREKNKLYSLTIERTPSDATVQILNIRPRYKDGIMLKKGAYIIRVFADGYIERNVTVELDDTLNYSIYLKSENSVLPSEEKVVDDTDIESEMVENNSSDSSFIEKTWENIKYYFKKIIMFLAIIIIIFGLFMLFGLEKGKIMLGLFVSLFIMSIGFVILSLLDGKLIFNSLMALIIFFILIILTDE